jgi:hypothetical protein
MNAICARFICKLEKENIDKLKQIAVVLEVSSQFPSPLINVCLITTVQKFQTGIHERIYDKLELS